MDLKLVLSFIVAPWTLVVLLSGTHVGRQILTGLYIYICKTPKSDGHTKVRWNRQNQMVCAKVRWVVGDGLALSPDQIPDSAKFGLLFGLFGLFGPAPKITPDSAKARWLRYDPTVCSYRHVTPKSDVQTRQSPMFVYALRYSDAAQKKSRLWCHVTGTFLVTLIITIQMQES